MLNGLKLGALSLTLVLAATASASLTYRVDPLNHLLILNGSATGTPAHITVFGEIRWGTGNLHEEDGGELGGEVRHEFTDPDENGLQFVQLEAYSLLSLHRIALSVQSIHQDTRSIEFSNLVLNYSLFSAGNRAYIDSLATTQNPLVLSVGNGYGNVVYAVPEPAYLALAMGAGVLVLLGVRRVVARRKTRRAAVIG